MTLASLFFYLFAAVMLASALMVISSKNPVHSVLFLIMAFVNGAGIFMLAGAEFLSLVLIVVYVGAVMVLFLFVVMMLDVDFAELRQGFMQYLPVGALVGIVLLVELVFVLGAYTLAPSLAELQSVPIPPPGEITNTEALGLVLYTRYAFYFQVCGLILLVAMIGAIVLTLRHNNFAKRQNIVEQVNRRREDTMEVKDVASGRGLQL
ncbi:NADH-quinone oxidoreductase subunit J [Acuticoccus sp. MNP-M23]|uniref:NADH-quinone oxidoreductase subunit J n=1 Tax=Acuticoccus sp. MNP-M23 TaxID=3072793 RepID=UPI002814E03B|nr:NADH-quinone oxidoreductase subunit J [Acuticoccus sp. MNP-M23]WMS42330.1 NADH-quinone oxidoreductase subunit J [Acuticoccus sp. MNP-M23]